MVVVVGARDGRVHRLPPALHDGGLPRTPISCSRSAGRRVVHAGSAIAIRLGRTTGLGSKLVGYAGAGGVSSSTPLSVPVGARAPVQADGRRMVIMAGMLPGVESARRRRIRQSSSGAAEARRASLCLYAGGRGRDLGLGPSSSAAASSKVSSGACGETTAAMARAWTTTLGSDAREAKERLDHKLRGQRQPVVLKRHQMSTRPPPAKPHDDAARGGTGAGGGHHRHHSATATPCGVLLQREVLSSPSRPRKGGGGRFGWCGLPGGRCAPPPEADTEAECAVCLEELRAGDVVARLPCAHRFHWSCAVPWVQAVSRCPVCRAHVHVCLATGGLS